MSDEAKAESAEWTVNLRRRTPDEQNVYWMEQHARWLVERSALLDSEARLKAEVEALATVNHSGPDVCPLWYDGCNCYEAFMYWKDRAEKLQADLAAAREQVRVLRGALRDWLSSKSVSYYGSKPAVEASDELIQRTADLLATEEPKPAGCTCGND
jgi:hypothetical protein